MTFIITLISFLIERFFDWSHLRRWHWFIRFDRELEVRFAKVPAWLVLIIVLGLPILLVALVDMLLTGWFFNIFKLVFGIVVLIYCMGPKNFWSQAYVSVKHLTGEEPLLGLPKISDIFGIQFPAEPQAFHRAFIHSIFVEANRRIFAVIFWFLLLGPVGAVLYRLTDLLQVNSLKTKIHAARCKMILDWLPVRVFSLLFALAGHFTAVFGLWEKYLLSPPVMNDVLLTECGIASLDVSDANLLPEDGSAETEALSLLDRAFVIMLVVLAIIVLLV